MTNNDDRIYDLVAEWDQRRQQGDEVSAAVICKDDPELISDVEERIASVKATDWFLDSDTDEDDDFLSLPSVLVKKSNTGFTSSSSLTVKQFKERILESGLVEAHQLETHYAATAEELAENLIDAQALTVYQVAQIGEGNAKSLVLGNYVILDKIGQGGMGAVFKARHKRMKRIVALKLLPEVALESASAVERFHREVEAAARLEHPNIVTAHDADECDGQHFLVMQHVKGEDLSSLVQSKGRLPIGKAVNCMIQAAKGLEYAHAQGIIHRDIKPANLLLNKKGVVKILDMGLAKLEQSDAAPQAELTQDGSVMGTVDYMAPEQALDTKGADARADIYSLGCTLCYLLTGKPIYGGSTLMAKMLAHRETAIPALSDERKDVPPELTTIFEKMVAKQPEERYASMAEVVTELEAVASQYEAEWTEYEDTVGAAAVETEEDLRSRETSSSDIGDTLATQPMVSPAIQPTPAERKVSPKRGLLIAVGLLLLIGLGGAWAAGIFLKVETSEGTIVLEIDQPELAGAVVSVDGEKKITIRTGEGQEPIEVSADEQKHTLKVVKGGFETFTKEFTLKAGGQQTIEVRLEPVAELSTKEPPADPVVPDGEAYTGRWQVRHNVPRLHKEIAWLPRHQQFGVFAYLSDEFWAFDPETLDPKWVWDFNSKQREGFSVSPTGEWLASQNHDQNRLRLWNLTTRTPGPEIQVGDIFYDSVWNPDGDRVLTVGTKGLKLWKLDGTLDRELTEKSYRSVDWSPDGKWLAAIDTEHKLAFLDPQTGQPVKQWSLPGQFYQVVFSPDSRQIATILAGEKAHHLTVFDCETQKQIFQGSRQSLSDHPGRRFACWSPDGRFLALARPRVVYDTDTWDICNKHPWAHHHGAWGIAWSSDSKQLVGYYGYARSGIIRAPLGKPVEGRWSPGAVSNLEWNPAREEFATTEDNGLTEDGFLTIWDADGIPQRQIKIDYSQWVKVAWHPSGKMLALGGNSQVSALNTTTGKPHFSVERKEAYSALVAWNAEGTKLAVRQPDAVEIWDETGKSLAKLETQEIQDLLWQGQSVLLLDTKSVTRWNPETGQVSKITDVYHHDRFKLHPDGKRLAICKDSRQLILFDLETNTKLFTYHDVDHIADLDWNPDGTKLAIIERNQTIRILHADGKPGPVSPGRGGYLSCKIRWSPDGQSLVSSNGVSLQGWAVDLKPLWTAFRLPENQSVKIGPDGELLHGTRELADEYLTFLVERKENIWEAVKPTEFWGDLQQQVLEAEKQALLEAELQAFSDAVAKMPPEEQVAAVVKKLQELNPEFDGEVSHKIEAGKVTELKFLTDHVTDIRPVRGLVDLKTLSCRRSGFDTSGKLPLISMKER